jgi:hypothetical protein
MAVSGKSTAASSGQAGRSAMTSSRPRPPRTVHRRTMSGGDGRLLSTTERRRSTSLSAIDDRISLPRISKNLDD